MRDALIDGFLSKAAGDDTTVDEVLVGMSGGGALGAGAMIPLKPQKDEGGEK